MTMEDKAKSKHILCKDGVNRINSFIEVLADKNMHA